MNGVPEQDAGPSMAAGAAKAPNSQQMNEHTSHHGAFLEGEFLFGNYSGAVNDCPINGVFEY